MNSFIGIISEDRPTLLIGLLGILKSGNSFVPINPAFPKERINYIISDCGITVILTDRVNYEEVQEIAEANPIVEHILCIDEVDNRETNFGLEKKNKAGEVDDPCYVIYTSGSTGRSKGVPITHRHLLPEFCWARDYMGLNRRNRVMQNLSYTFDFGVFEIFTTLLYGASLYVTDKKKVGNFGLYSRFINKHFIDTVHSTPAFFNSVISPSEEMPSLKVVHLGGERLTGNIVKSICAVVSLGCKIHNGYGPTEATINCSIYTLSPGQCESLDGSANIPIGRPTVLHRLYILDRNLRLLPEGLAGELCIAGAGIASGYLNNPELTNEKFVISQSSLAISSSSNSANDQCTVTDDRFYRTGDLVRWIYEGNIEFLGRIDFQVKVRGYRIELGEIESCLLKHPWIEEAVVTVGAHEFGDHYLCAYFVPNSRGDITVTMIREHLAKELPAYMIPAYFVRIERMPLTANGKVDKKSLPPPEESDIETATSYEAPVTALEKRLVKIWQELLRIERIGIRNDFFELGGDSILVNRCIAIIRTELNVEIPMRKFFELPYINTLAEEIEKQEREFLSIKPVERIGEIPLSFAQERLWFLQELDTGNVAYFVPRVIRIKGKLDVSLIERTFTEIILRHEILRTTFHTIDGQPVQRIQPPYEFKIHLINWMEQEKEEQEQRIANFLIEEGQRPFDFEHGPLLRVTILKLKEKEHLFVLTEHHLVHDGWTQGVLLREFIAIFSAYTDGKEHNLPELPIQYADFALWQRNLLIGDVLDRHLNYWKKKLSGLAPLLELPLDRPRPPVISGKGELAIVRFSGLYTLRLKEFSRKNGVTLFMTMLAVFKTLMYRYTGLEDLCVGTGMANRRYREMEGMLGMVINTLPLRTQVAGGISFKECLTLVKETCLEAYQYEDTPFGKIVEVIQPERNLSYTPLFQVLFSFMDTPGGELRLPGLELELLPMHNRSAKFDINVVVVPPREQGEYEENETGETLVEWEYNTDIFDASTIERMISHYNRLLEDALIRPETIISTLCLMSDDEIKQVIYEFNDTETAYPRERTIPELFEEQVSKMPDRIALVGTAAVETPCATPLQTTYRKLNEQSNWLAGLLIEKGVLPDTIVAIMLERSIEMIIGLFGILKAGGAYLPIDPEYPKERVNYMLKDSNSKIFINKSEIRIPKSCVQIDSNEANLNDRYKSCSFEISSVLDFEHLNVDIFANVSIRSSNLNSSNLAYTIYTSGSTGNPKGTLTTHANVSRVVRNTNYIVLSEKDRLLQLSNYAFDGSVFDIYGALLNGASLVLVGRETVLAVDRLAVLIQREQVTVFFVTTALFNTLVDLELTCLKSIRKVLFGGERVSVEHSRKALETLGKGKIIHVYGPTETTVYATYYFIDQIAENEVTVPIGKPIANTTIYIMDKHFNPVPLRIPGEIYIGGEGVARGYLNNPESTAEKFDRDKKNKTPYLYKTGDLARWVSNGNIEFLGRIDQQVKIRGFRIELGEIESRLLELDNVKEAVVIDRQDRGNKYLCAYIVSLAGSTTGAAELKMYLSESLPDYMIPSHFIMMGKIPLTSNGKIDRKAMPEPELGGAAREYAAPRDEMEKMIADIWEEVLKPRSVIGIDDDFFDLGGHSLNATLLTARMHKAFRVKIPLRDFFQRGCIRKLAEYIKEAVKDDYASVEPVEKRECYPLSAAQKRMYILRQMDEASTLYNVPAIMKLEGVVDKNHLEGVFWQLILRHECLRTSFVTINEEPMQRIHDKVEFKINYRNIATNIHGETRTFLTNLIRPFDLSKAPLMRVALLEEEAEKHFLMVDMHHIITDGTSMELFVKEFMTSYSGQELPPLKLRYIDYSGWQQGEQKKNTLKTQEEYWLGQFSETPPALELPLDFPRPLLKSFEGNGYSFEVTASETAALKYLASGQGTTLYMVLLALYYIFLSKITGQVDIVVGTPVAGRSHADLEPIMGIFINTLALRNNPAWEKNVKDFLKEVNENTLTAFANQDYPYEELVGKAVAIRDTGRNPLFDTMLNLRNMDISVIEIPGLKMTSFPFEENTSKFDLTLRAVDAPSNLRFTFEYCTKLFKMESIERFAGFFKAVVAQATQQSHFLIAEIELISEGERKQLLIDFNNTAVEYPREKTIHWLFEEQALKKPDHIAIIGAGSSAYMINLTYRQLDDLSARLANLMIGRGVLPDDVIGIMGNRAIETIAGVLGILKSGGAYLSIDPEYPQKRIDYMLKDSGAKIFLRKEECQKEIIVNCIEKSAPEAAFHHSSFIVHHAKHLAYIIYTSGSTGEPKGVMISHRNVVRLVKSANYVEFTPGDSILQTGALEFDASTFEIWGALLNGLKLVLVPKETILTPEKLKASIREYQISIMWMTSPLFNQMLQEDVGIFEGLKNLLLGGDVLAPLHIMRLRSIYPQLKVINGYGPTENTTFSTTFLISQEYTGNIPIGNPITNSTAYIIDKYNRLQPVGVPGELVVGGDGIARGYLNDPELTAEKFKRNVGSNLSFFTTNLFNLTDEKCPMATDYLYKTGDQARWLRGGNIEFLGRLDFQVKIRGFRVELGEIENRLLKHNDIKDSVVIAKEGIGIEKTHITAYIVSDREIEALELRGYLAGQLPDYMIPSYFVRLAKIPLTQTGKVDRKKLPVPLFTLSKKSEGPRNEIEKKLVELWSEILGRDAVHITQLQSSIGIEDNFFELGGHSLKATILLSRIEKLFNVKIPLVEVFNTPNIRGLSEFIEKLAKERSVQYKYISIEPTEEKKYYALSSAQKRLFFLQQMDKETTAYNISSAWLLEGFLDTNKLEDTFVRLLKRHESFRTSFVIAAEEPAQRIYEHVEFKVENYDLDAKGREKIHHASFMNTPNHFIRAFDLSKAPLIRVRLVKVKEEHLLMVDMHHIISDGMSIHVLVQDFSTLYAGNELPEIKLQYKDYAEWQNRERLTKKILDQGEYWKKQYEGEIPVLDLATDYVRPTVQSFEGNRINFETNRKNSNALKRLAMEAGATLYILLLALYTILLSKLSGQEDIIVGTPVAGRRHVDLEKIIGMFVNTLVLRNFPSNEKNFKNFLLEIKDRIIEAFENQEYQYEDLVEQFSGNRDVGRNPLFDTMFVMQNTGSHKIEIPGLNLIPYHYENKTSKFDMTLTVVEIEEKLHFTFEYSSKLFREATVERFSSHFINIMQGVIENSRGKISDLEIVSEKEKNQILFEFNDTEREYPKDKTIHRLFEEQAERTSDRIALVGTTNSIGFVSPVSLSYHQLNELSNRLASLLIGKSVLAGDIVAVMLERSIELVISTLGILKTEGAYLPIDPEYPQKRIAYMLKDSNAKILINKSEARKSKIAPNSNAQIINNLNKDNILGVPFVLSLEHLDFDIVSDSRFLISDFNSSNLAYVIYTSGSTGQPKGTVVIHRNVVRLVKNTNFVPLTGETRVLQTGAPVFDATTFELWGSLLNGGQLALVDKEMILDSHRLAKALREYQINTLWLSAPLFNRLMQQNIELFAPLSYLLVGGDVLTPENINHVRCQFPRLKIINGYGPTENTTFSTTYLIEKEFAHSIPIGRPIANTSVYICDKNCQLVPVGIWGELYVGGDGVSLGYLNNPELTAEKFQFNWPYRSFKTYILYKTGDRVRWLDDGNIEFFGRIDQQIKIRGFRVELGEIENRLLTHPNIMETTVLANEDISGEKYLSAYFVSAQMIPELELREYLSKQLPHYMIPTYFIQIEKIPLTQNGKIDQNALPSPEIKVLAERIAPRNKIEEDIVSLWSEILSRDSSQEAQLRKSIGIHDDFFKLGGDSLKAMLLTTKLQKFFNVKVPLAELFEKPTVNELSKYIMEAKAENYESIEPSEMKEYYLLSSAQKRIYTALQLEPESKSYNVTIILQLIGDLSIEQLQDTFIQVIARHESLRASFEMIENNPVQRIHDEVEFRIEYCTDRKDVTALRKYIRPFELRQAPLLRVYVMKNGDREYVMMSDMSHLISDGVSFWVMAKELMTLYNKQHLPPLNIQYKDFSEWENRLLCSGKIKKQEDFWLDALKGELPTLELPTDFPRPSLRNIDAGDIISTILEESLTLKLYDVIRETDTTLFTFLLTVYFVLLNKYTGQKDIVVGTVVTGRTHSDLQNLIGVFINMLPLRNYPQPGKRFINFLEEVKENTLNAFENQTYPTEELVKKLEIQNRPGRHPLFDTEFAVNNIDEEEIEIPGLKLKGYGAGINFAKFDLHFLATENNNSIRIVLRYSTELFEKSTAKLVLGNYAEIIEQVAENLELKLEDINLTVNLLSAEPIMLNEEKGDFEL